MSQKQSPEVDLSKPFSGPLPKAKLNGKSSSEMKHISELCKNFLAESIPESNVVFQEDFKKFTPLFNKEMFSKMNQDEASTLANEYYMHFSLHHPVYVLTHELDSENGIFHKATGRKFKVYVTLPAVFAKVRTINELHSKCGVLFQMLRSASSSSNPLDRRADDYSTAITEAIKRANTKEEKIAQNKEFDRQCAEFKKQIAAASSEEDGENQEEPHAPETIDELEKESEKQDDKNEQQDDNCMTGFLSW